MRLLIGIILAIVICIIMYRDQIKSQVIMLLTILRGILAPNCTWLRISPYITKDSNGVNLYSRLKHNSTDGIIDYNMLGTQMNGITDLNMIREILEGSPYPFGVGKFKKRFFQSFMPQNVGVSQGCPWYNRRLFNEHVLATDKKHPLNPYIHEYTKHHMHNKVLNPDAFTKFAKDVTNQIVFNTSEYPAELFDIFMEANSIKSLFTEIDLPSKAQYLVYLRKQIQNPQPHSLIYSAIQITNNEDELIQQIPHLIFPIAGIGINHLPRLLTVLINAPNKYNKLIQELSMCQNLDDALEVDKLQYLRWCILEMFRLNNPVSSTFRTLLDDYVFSNGKRFPKGSHFLILNNPILRDTDSWPDSNSFVPERWHNKELEQESRAMMFNHGPQRCPGKELAIFVFKSALVRFFQVHGLLKGNILEGSMINVNDMPQIINPCLAHFKVRTLL